MIRALLQFLCGLTGHGPWDRRGAVSMLHDGELRRARRCGVCGAIVLGAVDG